VLLVALLLNNLLYFDDLLAGREKESCKGKYSK
jgi:hypothetical protein